MQEQSSSTRSRDFQRRRQSNDKALRNSNATFNHAQTTTAQLGSDVLLPSSTNAAGTPASPFPVASSIAHTPQVDNAVSTPSDFTSYRFNQGANMLGVDWGTGVDFADFSSYFEPVGELQEDLQGPQGAKQDFIIPQPLTNFNDFSIQPGESTTYAPTITSPPPDPSTIALGVSSTSQSSTQPIAPPTTHPAAQARLKRKADSDPSPAVPVVAVDGDSAEPAAKRTAKPKPSSSTQAKSDPPPPPPPPPRSNSGSSSSKEPAASTRPSEESAGTTSSVKQAMSDSSSSGAVKTGATGPAGRVRTIPDVNVSIGAVLPAGKVFPVQIGSELFRLSGASISSDAPSYFSHFFGEQLYSSAGRGGNMRTLYIDRDPETFKDISLHLQGYHITPRDGSHFVRLFADAQFYSLPRLIKQLFKSEIFVQIGERHFRLPRDIFSSPGDSPNYFSLGFAHFFSTPSEAFPGLDRQALLRPPSILPPAVPNRSGDVFADLVHIMRGYPVHIRDEAHRADMLRDARYFHLKGVEQKLIPCDISFNLARNAREITIRLEDIRQSGISFASSDNATPDFSSKPTTPSSAVSTTGPGFAIPPLRGYVSYARPFTDENVSVMIVEIGGPTESMRLDVNVMRCSFVGQTKARIASLFQVVANKLNLPATQPLGLMMTQTGGGLAAQPASPANSGLSGERVKVSIARDAWVELDGREISWSDKKGEEDEGQLPPSKNLSIGMSNADWVVIRGQWRLKIQPHEDESGRVELVMSAVKVQAYTAEKARNGKRKFLA